MIDLWLEMQQCMKDSEDDIYYVGGDFPVLLGKYLGHHVDGDMIHIDIKKQLNVAVDFLNIDVRIND